MDALPSKKPILAKESYKIGKAREKLKLRFEMMDKQITREALNKKSLEMHRWISRHVENRLVLKDKNIALFDENQNAVQVSQKIAKIAEKIQDNTSTEINLDEI